jgi:hypothetical protein
VNAAGLLLGMKRLISRFNAACLSPEDSGREWLANPLIFGRYPAMADLLNQWHSMVMYNQVMSKNGHQVKINAA